MNRRAARLALAVAAAILAPCSPPGAKISGAARQRHSAQGPEGRSYEEILAELRAVTDKEHDQVVAAGAN